MTVGNYEEHKAIGRDSAWPPNCDERAKATDGFLGQENDCMNYGWGPWRPSSNPSEGVPATRECPVYLEARRKLWAGEMEVTDILKWMESQPGWAPVPNCMCEGCKQNANTESEHAQEETQNRSSI